MPVTKEQLKTLVIADEKMSLWCSVILGEICELVASYEQVEHPIELLDAIVDRVKELDRLIIQRVIDQAEEKLKKASEAVATAQATTENTYNSMRGNTVGPFHTGFSSLSFEYVAQAEPDYFRTLLVPPLV